MAQIFSPYGLRVAKTLGQQYFTGGMTTYPVTDPTAFATTGAFFGDPVGLQGGSVVPLPATPTPALPGAVGIFQGVEWQDPFRGFVNAQFLPAGIFASGATKVRIKVMDYPDVIMRVQADGPIALGAALSIGSNGSLLGFGNGSIFTGNSRVYLSTNPTTPPGTAGPALGPTATFAVRIVGFVNDAVPSPGAGSAPGDAFTDVYVTWNFGVHRYRNATGG